MKYFKFSVYEVGCGTECFSGTSDYYESGNDVKHAKRKMVAKNGTYKDYYNDKDYVTIIEISKEEFDKQPIDLGRFPHCAIS